MSQNETMIGKSAVLNSGGPEMTIVDGKVRAGIDKHGSYRIEQLLCVWEIDPEYRPGLKYHAWFDRRMLKIRSGWENSERVGPASSPAWDKIAQASEYGTLNNRYFNGN